MFPCTCFLQLSTVCNGTPAFELLKEHMSYQEINICKVHTTQRCSSTVMVSQTSGVRAGEGETTTHSHRLKHFNPSRGKELIYFLSSSRRFGLQNCTKKNSGNTFQRIKIFARKKVAFVCAALLIEC